MYLEGKIKKDRWKKRGTEHQLEKKTSKIANKEKMKGKKNDRVRKRRSRNRNQTERIKAGWEGKK